MGSTSPNTTGKPIRCKAAIGRKAGEPLVIEEIEVAPPKAYEVRIKILCTSLCHSDITGWKMEAPIGVYPTIFGHEAIGVVESVGDYVEEVKEGDRVVPSFLANCNECIDCKSEKSNMCTKFQFRTGAGMPRDGTSRFIDSNGDVVHHFLSVSSFVEYTVVDIAHVVKISTEIALDKACLLSCGVSTGLGAAWKVADVQKDSTVAIFGLGVVGLMVNAIVLLASTPQSDDLLWVLWELCGISSSDSRRQVLLALGPRAFSRVYALWKVPELLPVFMLKGGKVSHFIIGGAYLMFPGISIPAEGVLPFQAGQPWAVTVPNNVAPIAVGTTTMSSTEALKAGLRGKALRITHCYRDSLLQGICEGHYVSNARFLEDGICCA